jgi:hypothetical protein
MNAHKTGLLGVSGAALIALVGLLSAACGSGDDNAAPAKTTDAGGDSTTPTSDAALDSTVITSDGGDAAAAPDVSSDAAATGAVYPLESGCSATSADPLNSCSTVSTVTCYPFTLTVPDASF